MIKPLLKCEVNNETFLTSLRSYHQIYYYNKQCKYLFVLEDGDTTRNLNQSKYLHL